MSTYKYLYLGYYFSITPIKVKHTFVYDGCAKCETDLKTPFCPTCGQQCQEDLERVRTYNADTFDICKELGDEWTHYLVGVDSLSDENRSICAINIKGSDNLSMSEYDPFEYDFVDHIIPPMSEKAKRFMNVYEDRYGKGSIKAHYGLIRYFL
jgi:hypothetical protein